MEIALLVLEYVKAVVWPAVVVFGLLLFRKPLATMLHRLKGAGLPGGVSLDFGQEVQEARTLSHQVADAPKKEGAEASTPTIPLTEANERMLSLGLEPSPSGLDMTRYSDLADQDPNLALAGLRMEVESLSRNLARGFSVEVKPRESALTLLRRLRDAGSITTTQFQLAEKVVQLCNAAIHGTRVSRSDAESVIDSASVLAEDYLEWLSWGFDDDWVPGDQNGG